VKPVFEYGEGLKEFRQHPKFDDDEMYVVSFSGGRSSATLLKFLLEEFGGTLPPNFIVLFANTGKEHPGTLDFVHEVEERWDVNIHWLEFAGVDLDDKNPIQEATFRVNRVDYESASRNGEPWIRVIETNPGYAPRRAVRLCTFYMKVGAMWSYMYHNKLMITSKHKPSPFTNIVGFRKDELSRLHATEMKCGRDPARPKVIAPLVHAGITKHGVTRFWKDQPFDLDIPPGTGNCDLCFLKGRRELMKVANANPGMIDWWIEADRYAIELGASRPMLPEGGYAALLENVKEQSGDLGEDNLLSLECSCTD